MKYRFLFLLTADSNDPVLFGLENEAVSSSRYPNLFKIARVTLVHTSDCNLDFKYFRLMLVLPFLNKVSRSFSPWKSTLISQL